MTGNSEKSTKSRIVFAAWKLFYDKGYENTTVDEIVYESGTSKGSFYHYFSGKDALLSSLSILFDEKYEELSDILSSDGTAYEKLLYLNRELFGMIENSVSLELLKRLYSTQLTGSGSKNLLDRNRTYYKFLRKIITVGQENGEFKSEFSVAEIVKAYAMCERALIYDWCLSDGEYSLRKYSSQILPMFLRGFLN